MADKSKTHLFLVICRIDQGVDARDVELLLPEALTTAREWFKVYKVAEGKGENSFAYNGECLKKVGPFEEELFRTVAEFSRLC